MHVTCRMVPCFPGISNESGLHVCRVWWWWGEGDGWCLAQQHTSFWHTRHLRLPLLAGGNCGGYVSGVTVSGL